MKHLRQFLEVYRSNSGLRGPILQLLSATGYASIAGYFGMLVLVRLYPAESFGLFDFIISVVGIMTPFVSLRYEDSLMLVEEDRDGAHAFILSMGTAVVLSASLWIAYPFRNAIAAFFDNESIAGWIWIIPIMLVFVRYTKISELWLSRHERFGRVSVGQVAQTTTMIGGRIGAGLYSPSPAGLVYGYILGLFVGSLVNVKLVLSTLRSGLSRGFSFGLIRYLAGRYRRFPMFTMPAAMISMLGSRLPFLLLLYFFSLETVGYFGRAFNVLFIPLSLVGGAVAQVFFVRAVEANRNNTLAEITTTIHRRLVFLAWFPATVLMIAGPDLFHFLFGESWRMSGVMARYMAPWILFSAIASPLSRLFDVLERQKLELITNAVIFAVIAGALVYGGTRDDLMLSLLLLGIGGGIIRVWQIIILVKLSGVNAASFVRPYVRYLFFSLPWLFMVLAAVLWSTRLMVFATTLIGAIGFLGSVVLNEGLLEKHSSGLQNEV